MSGVAMWALGFGLLASMAASAVQAKDFGDERPSASQIVEALTQTPKVIGKGAGKKPRISLRVQFELDSSRIDAQYSAALEELAKALDDDRLRARRYGIVGHTDKTGTASHNLRLSRERAQAVTAFLTSQRIDAARLVPEGRGFKELLDDVDPKSAQHRRVEVVQLSD